MAKIELKGTIRLVYQKEYVGENKTEKVSFILDVKGYTDDFGEQKGRDQAWKIDVFGKDKIIDFMNTIGPVMEGVKGTASIYVESTEVVAKDTSKPNMFIVNNNIDKFSIFVPKSKSV